MDIRYFDVLESTNRHCELLNLNQIEEFVVICALNQTAGRGQGSHTWESQPNKNLSFSIILHPTLLPIPQQFMLTKVLSLGISDHLQKMVPNHKVHIKWPNDIYVDNRKICGILVKAQLHGKIFQHAICGIGINVNQTQFSEWIPNPTSLKLLTEKDYPLDEILPQFIQSIQLRYQQLSNSQETLNQDYLSILLNRGTMRRYHYHDDIITATILDVNDFGHLRLLTSQGSTIICQHGEISLIQ